MVDRSCLVLSGNSGSGRCAWERRRRGIGTVMAKVSIYEHGYCISTVWSPIGQLIVIMSLNTELHAHGANAASLWICRYLRVRVFVLKKS